MPPKPPPPKKISLFLTQSPSFFQHQSPTLALGKALGKVHMYARLTTDDCTAGMLGSQGHMEHITQSHLRYYECVQVYSLKLTSHFLDILTDSQTNKWLGRQMVSYIHNL